MPGTWVYKDGVSAEVRFTFREDGGYMVYVDNTGSESTSYGKWRADGKNGNNINFYDDEQPMLGAVGGAAYPCGRTMRIGYGMVGVHTTKTVRRSGVMSRTKNWTEQSRLSVNDVSK